MSNKDISADFKRNEEILEHYGVLGMKWGVRRSRAERRAAAKRRKSSSTDKKKKKEKKKKPVRKLSDMSNREIAARNKRMNLEKEYKKLSAGQKSKGRKIVENLLTDVAQDSAKVYLKKFAEQEINKSFERTKKGK